MASESNDLLVSMFLEKSSSFSPELVRRIIDCLAKNDLVLYTDFCIEPYRQSFSEEAMEISTAETAAPVFTMNLSGRAGKFFAHSSPVGTNYHYILANGYTLILPANDVFRVAKRCYELLGQAGRTTMTARGYSKGDFDAVSFKTSAYLVKFLENIEDVMGEGKFFAVVKGQME